MVGWDGCCLLSLMLMLLMTSCWSIRIGLFREVCLTAKWKVLLFDRLDWEKGWWCFVLKDLGLVRLSMVVLGIVLMFGTMEIHVIPFLVDYFICYLAWLSTAGVGLSSFGWKMMVSCLLVSWCVFSQWWFSFYFFCFLCLLLYILKPQACLLQPSNCTSSCLCVGLITVQ